MQNILERNYMARHNYDNIHLDLSSMFGEHRPFKAVISPRGPGKSTAFWRFAYSLFKKGRHVLVIRRRIVAITTSYIDDIARCINKFLDDKDKIKIWYRQADCKQGIVDVYVGEGPYDKNKQLFFRVLALAIPMDRIKSSTIDRLGAILFDEFIVNIRKGEQYLPGEIFSFKEVYTTYIREGEGTVQTIFMGNPYSLFNPYFVDWGINIKELYPGNKVRTPKAVVWCYQLSEELKQLIKEQNPILGFEDEYTKYAFDGRSINDANVIIIDKQPDNFKQSYIFKYDSKYLIVYGYTYPIENFTQTIVDRVNQNAVDYWCKVVDKIETKQLITCFDIGAISDGAYLISNRDRMMYAPLTNAFRTHRIAFETLEANYLMEYIFVQL